MLKIFFVSFFVSFFVTLSAFAQNSSGSSSSGGRDRPWLLSQGAAAREAKRFTLSEWLDNKNRRNMMDMWLSMNTPTPYEFYISGSQQNYTTSASSNNISVENNHTVLNGEVTAYARFVGLTFEHVNNTEEGFNDTTGIFNLRIFGDMVQGSHITLHYGLRTRTAHDGSYRLNQPFPAATMQLYLMKYFGIQGNYRFYGNTSEPFFGDSTTDEQTYRAFIEYGSFRIFGDYYMERQNSKLNSVETNYKREGTRVGLKIFF